MQVTVRQKIQLPIIGFIAFLSLFAFIYFPYVQKNALEESFSNEVQSLARMAAHGITTGLNNDDFTSIRSALDFVKTSPSVRFVALVSDGETIAAYPDGFVFSEEYATSDSLMIGDFPITSYLIPGRIYVGSSTSDIKKLLHRTRLTTTWVALATLLIGIFFGMWQARLIVRPLRLLQLASIKVGQGRLDTIVTRKSNDEIGDLADEFGKMVLSVRQAQTRVQEANDELQAKNELIESDKKRLEETLQHLKQTQTYLVNAEKMAALGHLIAGIAHEINTPLGAIRASINNIENALSHTLHKLPELVASLSDEQVVQFDLLVSDSLKQSVSLSAKEERRHKRELHAALMESNYPLAEEISELLADMGIFEGFQKYDQVLHSKNVLDVLHTASRLALQQRNAKNINVAVERASKIVFALKNYSRQDLSGEKARVSISDGIDTVLILYHNQIKHGVEIVRDYEDIPDMLCYPDELNQVWTNIIHNALQAMDNEGTLRISTRRVGDNIRVVISDTGHGIPQEIQSKIFDPFYTTKPTGEGTGLGLDIVHQLILKHEGSISVESKPGETNFIITLPYDDTELA
jgi:signal transduction histidine kinase